MDSIKKFPDHFSEKVSVSIMLWFVFSENRVVSIRILRKNPRKFFMFNIYIE